MIDRPIIVSSIDHGKLETRAKFWWSGWVTSVALVGVVSYMAGRNIESLRSTRELQMLTAEVRNVQVDQKDVNDAFVKAWSHQASTARMLISWAEYVKQRDDIIAENKGGQKMAGKGM